MSYIGLALSTPKVRVNASPSSFDISSEASNEIREYTISHIDSLQEIAENLATNSPKYILICYFDGSKRYFSYNKTFCAVFEMVLQHAPHKETSTNYVSPLTFQRNVTPPTSSYENPIQPQNQVASYTIPRTNPQHSATQTTISFPWKKLLLGIGIFILVIIVIIERMVENTDTNTNANTGLTPVLEPQSGAILTGIEVYDGSEITVAASSGESCVVKLKTSSGIERISFYVRAGDTVTIGVPAEYLYVYFASGNTWYGTAHLFGEKTSYSMDDEICDFTESTWKYTLYPVSNGNFSQTPIDEDDFK